MRLPEALSVRRFCQPARLGVQCPKTPNIGNIWTPSLRVGDLHLPTHVGMGAVCPSVQEFLDARVVERAYGSGGSGVSGSISISNSSSSAIFTNATLPVNFPCNPMT